MVWMTAVLSMEQKTAQGVNLLYFLPCAVCALIFHIKNRQIVWRAVWPAALAGAVCAAGGALLHGECVAIGMPPFAGGAAKERLLALLVRFGLPVEVPYGAAELLPYLTHDKKSQGKEIVTVEVDEIGQYAFVAHRPEEILRKAGETV